jgi:hypothetical protein
MLTLQGLRKMNSDLLLKIVRLLTKVNVINEIGETKSSVGIIERVERGLKCT